MTNSPSLSFTISVENGAPLGCWFPARAATTRTTAAARSSAARLRRCFPACMVTSVSGSPTTLVCCFDHLRSRHLLAEHALHQVLLFGLEDGLGVHAAEDVQEHGDGPRPTGLMTGSKSGTVVAVEVFVEEDEIAPVRILLELCCSSVHRA